MKYHTNPHMLSICVLFTILGLSLSVLKCLSSTDNSLISIQSTIKKQKQKKEPFSLFCKTTSLEDFLIYTVNFSFILYTMN